MKEETEEDYKLIDNGLYVKINTELKNQFRLETFKRNTTMSEAIINFIREYIQETN